MSPGIDRTLAQIISLGDHFEIRLFLALVQWGYTAVQRSYGPTRLDRRHAVQNNMRDTVKHVDSLAKKRKSEHLSFNRRFKTSCVYT